MDKLLTLGERLRYAREKAGISQEALAKRIPAKNAKGHVSTGLIGQLERDENAGSKHLAKAAQLLGVTLDWLEYGLNESETLKPVTGGIPVATATQAAAQAFKASQVVSGMDEAQFIKMFLLFCNIDEPVQNKQSNQSISGNSNFQIGGNHTGDIKK